MAIFYDNQAQWNTPAVGVAYGWNSATGVGYGPPRAADARKALQPLLDPIRQYDTLRLKLESEGGSMSDLKGITALLAQSILLKGPYRENNVMLVDQPSIRAALYDLGLNDVHMAVRKLRTGMPVYYFCRIRRDYWSAYSLIVEDLYQSSGYPMVDERFVRLMDNGHETYYLRLSQFRESINAYNRDQQVDDLLYRAGRHVFQAAWHEDQRPGVLTAQHFGLPHFKQAIELLYLCLSGELCELRNVTDASLLTFFETTYPQPALHAFLRHLNGLDGAAINDLPREALKLYARLSTAFSRFLSVEVAWGHRKTTLPLYKLIFGNFGRLEMIAATLAGRQNVKDAAQAIEQRSQSIITEITGAS